MCNTQTHVQTHTHTHTHTHTLTHTHTHIRTNTHTYTRTRTHAHTHTHIHTNTHVHTYTHPQRSTQRSRCPFSGMRSFRGPRQLARTGGSKMLPMLACRRERHQSCAAPRMACRCKCVWKRTNPILDNMEAHGGFVSARVNGAKDTRFVKSPGINMQSKQLPILHIYFARISNISLLVCIPCSLRAMTLTHPPPCFLPPSL